MPAFQVKDRIAQGDNKYIIQELENGKSALVHSPDLVSEKGTPFNKATIQPLFDAEYNSTAFVFNISSSNEATPVGEKTFAEFFEAITKGYNAIGYGIRTSEQTVLRPIGMMSDALVLLCETSILNPLRQQFWGLSAEGMTFAKSFSPSTGIYKSTATVTTDSNGDVMFSDNISYPLIAVAETLEFVPCRCYTIPNYMGGLSFRITTLDDDSPLRNTEIRLTTYKTEIWMLW